MNKFTKKFFISVLLITVCLCGAIGCNQPSFEPPEDPSTVKGVQYVTYEQLGLTPYEITSSNPEIATVDFDFQDKLCITAYLKGQVEITVKDYLGRVAFVSVEVQKNTEYEILTTPTACVDKSVVDVKIDFGAKGDGQANDTEVIQQAINCGAQKNAKVFFPAGVYVIDSLELQEKSNVVLQGKASDYIKEDCVNQENYQLMKEGKNFAVLRTAGAHKFMLINNPYKGEATSGRSDITFTGGVIDMDTNSYGGGVYSFVFTCGKNITLEETIMLDCYNDHTIQVSGCTNVKIKNCILAGYKYFSANREAIQVETAKSGCNSAATYSTGEYYESNNVAIEGCYFGPTPINSAPPMGVGHHGAAAYMGRPDVTGLTIKDCIFEKCGYSAIRQPNTKNLVIEGNTFITDGKSDVTENPSCIDLYLLKQKVNYKLDDGSSVIVSTEKEKYGIDVIIKNNVFNIGGEESNYRAVTFGGESLSERGASIEKSFKRKENTDAEIFNHHGFYVNDRTIHDVEFLGNQINITATTTYTDAFIKSSVPIFGFDYLDNQINTNNIYTENFNGNTGLMGDFRVGADAQKRVITSFRDTYKIIFNLPTGQKQTLTSQTDENNSLTLHTDGNGEILLWIELNKASQTSYHNYLVVSLKSNDGYVFDGWYTLSGEKVTIDGTIDQPTEWIAKFKKIGE